MPQTVFITGASTGLGRATAVLFANRGWNVIATMRTPDEKLAAVPGIGVMALDVSQPDQIADVTARVLAQGPVDVVFNNAGYGLGGPLEGTTEEQLTAQVNTNLLGVIRVTKAFIPAFRERGTGTFIATTSIGAHITFPFFSLYHATKWALEGFSESLAFELGQFGILVKTVAPGGIRTDFSGRSLVFAQHDAYADAVGRVVTAFGDPARAAQASSPEAIAEVVWEAATDGKNQVTYLAGADAVAMHSQRLAAGAEAFRTQIGRTFLGQE